MAWSEYEGCDADEDFDDRDLFLEVIRDVLIKAARDDAFGMVVRDDAWVEEPLDEHVVRLCRGLGLPELAALQWRDLPDAPPDALLPPDDEDDPPGESSA